MQPSISLTLPSAVLRANSSRLRRTGAPTRINHHNEGNIPCRRFREEPLCDFPPIGQCLSAQSIQHMAHEHDDLECRGRQSDQQALVVSGQNHDRGFATPQPLMCAQLDSPAPVASKIRSNVRELLHQIEAPRGRASFLFPPCGRIVNTFMWKCRVPEEAWRFLCRRTAVPQAQKSLDAWLFWAGVMKAPDREREREIERTRERLKEREGERKRKSDKEIRELESDDTRRQVLKRD